MNINEIILESYENREFEYKVVEYLEKKIVNPPVYLSVGETHIPVILKHALKDNSIIDYMIAAQHRSHSYYLSFSEDRENAMRLLSRELCGRLDGCGKGMTGSPSSHIPNKLLGHDGHLASQFPIGAGYAQASQKPTIIIGGDASVELDYALASFGMVVTHNLPVLFIVHDNNRSILTPKSVRRSWNIHEVCSGFGIESYNLEDDWESIYNHISHWAKSPNYPLLLNINLERHLWHCGGGVDEAPKWDSLQDHIEEFKDNWYPTNSLDKCRQRVTKVWSELDE